MEQKKQSGGGIVSIIGIVIVGAFASAVGKSCGKSVASNHNNAPHVTPAPPSLSELKEYDVAGLSLLLPGSPQLYSNELPPGASNIVKSLETYKVSDSSMNVAITYAVYVNPEVNLDGSADGAINGVRNLPSVRLFTSSTNETTVDGLEGRELAMNFMDPESQINQHGLVFARNGEYWQIQIIGEGIQNRAALAKLKDTIFGSIRLSTKN